jgi:hypothetical protein
VKRFWLLLAVALWCGLLPWPLRSQESLFPAGKTGNDSGPEGTFYELGTIFRPTVSGVVTHLRVYALASESGEHSARLWHNATGTLIGGPYAWTYGGAAGWVTLDIPDVAVSANTDYTVVVATGGGGRNYPFLGGDLATAGGNGAHLTHPANAGVFSTTAGVRPVATFNSANYLRDVVFVPDPIEPPTNAPVRLNEILAENKAGLVDEDADASDWIELYNPKGETVSLAGYQLLDRTNTWTFPPTNMGPRSFLVVFASGKNRTNSPLHTNFKLDGDGEYLALKDAGGAVISEFAPAFPPQRKNVAYGRGLAGDTGFLPTPTPGGPNVGAFAGFVADTRFSVKRGFFTSAVEVAVTTLTTGATVRFTLNGATPTEMSPALTAPLIISNTTTLRARAFKPGFIPTDTDTDTYIFPNDLVQQTPASALAYGWPPGPINGQALRYGLNPSLQSLYSPTQKIAALTQVPMLSLVTDQANLTGASRGIYVNAATEGLEQAGSLELIQPDGTPGFSVDAGVRIRGGQSRGGNFPKHSFNLFFRDEYGAPKLDFPLFGPDGANKFDTISLRCEHGYAYADPYPLDIRLDFTALRDVACRDLWAAAGYASTRSSYYHLLLNGQYWGLYQTQERAQEDFGATYFGGKASDYDGVAATGLPQLTIEVTSGDLAAWTQLWSGCRAVNTNPTPATYLALLGRNADGTRNLALPVLLDPHELASYLLLHYYTGHSDEPLSVSFNFEKPNNFRALRRRGTNDPWHFLVHDGESSLRAAQWVDNRANAVNLVSSNRTQLQFSNPEWMHEDLLASPEYRLVFADEAQRLLFNDGAFTASRAQSIWDRLAARIDQAVIGESLRWAQSTAENRTNWLAEVNDVRVQFFPTRSAIVVAQLRQRNLFPSVNAPIFSQRGGLVAPGFSFTLSAAAGGSIYYTLDGSDPRAIGGATAGLVYTNAIVVNATMRVRTRFRSGAGEWSALDDVSFTPFLPASATNLIVSKVHYHPLPPSDAELAAGFNGDADFEYLELQNVSDLTVDLRGVQINAGVTFNFADASMTTLAPGARVCLVENPAAFALRYGSNLPVAGEYTGNLSNGGETVRVVDALGTNIALFTYDDFGPWPISPDGFGPALVLKAPNLNPTNGANWRASYATGGKPGAADDYTVQDWRREHFSAVDLADSAQETTLWGDAADPDGDGVSNLAEYALGGTSPTNAASHPRLTASLFSEGGATWLRGEYFLRNGVIGVTVTPQVSTDLIVWHDLSPLSMAGESENITRAIVQAPQPIGTASPPYRFLRVRVTTP